VERDDPGRTRGGWPGQDDLVVVGPTLGNAEAGIAAALVGLRGSVVAGGALCIAGSAALALALPRFWRYDSRRVAS
jgi:hypothetical protein